MCMLLDIPLQEYPDTFRKINVIAAPSVTQDVNHYQEKPQNEDLEEGCRL